MYLALRKCKNDRKILKIIRVPDFCPLKPDIARFSIGFRLNISSVTARLYEKIPTLDRRQFWSCVRESRDVLTVVDRLKKILDKNYY